jgi:hypothetical protein
MSSDNDLEFLESYLHTLQTERARLDLLSDEDLIIPTEPTPPSQRPNGRHDSRMITASMAASSLHSSSITRARKTAAGTTIA